MSTELWEIHGIGVTEIVRASTSWEAWDKALKDRPECVGLIVTARRVYDDESEEIGVHGVGLLKRWGLFETARLLDNLAIEEGLGSVWDKYPNE